MHSLYYWLTSFGVLEFIGDVYPGYIANHLCFPVLGCNMGFVGYDGFMHFVSGLCVGAALLWLSERRGWRSDALAFAFWGTSVALVWELIEWSYDLIRIHLLDMDLFNPNRLTQPNSLDTIGDIVLACAGTALFYLFIYLGRRKKADTAA